METLQITNKLYQNWITTQVKLSTGWSFSFPFIASHIKIGKAIFGDNLDQARNWIQEYRYSPDKLTMEVLRQFEHKESNMPKELQMVSKSIVLLMEASTNDVGEDINDMSLSWLDLFLCHEMSCPLYVKKLDSTFYIGDFLELHYPTDKKVSIKLRCNKKVVNEKMPTINDIAFKLSQIKRYPVDVVEENYELFIPQSALKQFATDVTAKELNAGGSIVAVNLQFNYEIDEYTRLYLKLVTCRYEEKDGIYINLNFEHRVCRRNQLVDILTLENKLLDIGYSKIRATLATLTEYHKLLLKAQ